jgi:hypothetical protein
LGLYVQFIGGNPVSTAQLIAAYNQVASTPAGAAWINTLENSPILYTISDNPLFPNNAYFDPNNNIIDVDPNFHPHIATLCGVEQASTAVILAHELTHAATGALDNGPDFMANVIENENLIRPQLGLPPRTAYPTPAPFLRGR